MEIKLTPQNEEWIDMIPVPTKNLDLVMNKLLETCINEGILLEVISGALSTKDLSLFKSSYSKLQKARATHLDALDIKPIQVERKKVTQTITQEVQQEEVVPSVSKPAPKAIQKKVSGSGWDEDSF